MLKVVLTGGPCGGKSTSQSILKEKLEARGYNVLFVPETPTILMTSGISFTNFGNDKFQSMVTQMQLEHENLYLNAAKKLGDKTVVLFDRGLCDQMAYYPYDKFANLMKENGMTMAQVYDRYDAVLHLTTAAKGARQYYQWNDPNREDLGNNAARYTNPDQAVIDDDNTMRAWVGHPHLRIFDNSEFFDKKINKVFEEVCLLLGEPVPKEIERKYLVELPSENQLQSLDFVNKSNIVQTYLDPSGDIERRVRQRGTKERGYSYFYTEKYPLATGERIERDRIISVSEYVNYLNEADPNKQQIHKDRYCFLYENQYFELDVFQKDKKYALLEIELGDINEKVNLPKWLKVIRDVTKEEDFYNSHIATVGQLDLIEKGNKIDLSPETWKNSPWVKESNGGIKK